MDQANNKAKSIFHILLAAFGFAAMSLFVRLSGDLPTAEKAFFRNLIAAIVALYMLKKKRAETSDQRGVSTHAAASQHCRNNRNLREFLGDQSHGHSGCQYLK